MLTEDYILRMIKDMTRMVSRVLFGKDSDPPAFEIVSGTEITALPPLSKKLRTLCDEGQINQAEDLLFSELDFSNPQEFFIVEDFYTYLSKFSEARLEECGYSREEIFEGFKDCAREFGVDNLLLDAFQP